MLLLTSTSGLKLYYTYAKYLRARFGHIYQYNQYLKRFYDIDRIIPDAEIKKYPGCLLFYSQNYGEMSVKDSRNNEEKLKILSSIPQEALYSYK